MGKLDRSLTLFQSDIPTSSLETTHRANSLPLIPERDGRDVRHEYRVPSLLRQIRSSAALSFHSRLSSTIREAQGNGGGEHRRSAADDRPRRPPTILLLNYRRANSPVGWSALVRATNIDPVETTVRRGWTEELASTEKMHHEWVYIGAATV